MLASVRDAAGKLPGVRVGGSSAQSAPSSTPPSSKRSPQPSPTPPQPASPTPSSAPPEESPSGPLGRFAEPLLQSPLGWSRLRYSDRRSHTWRDRGTVTHTVGIYLFDEVEVLDFAGPFEVFSTATRVGARLDPGAPAAFEVLTVADAARTVRARGGLSVQSDFDLATSPRIDVLVVPGGVVTAELGRDDVVDWIARVARSSTVTASVCTGAFLLARAGLLRGLEATTHWEDVAELRATFPDVTVREEVRWIDAGPVVTSAGISAGLDMSLHLVERLEGAELARSTARQMELDWHGTGS